MTATIKFYSHARGFGFLDCQELKRDIFFHCSSLLEDERRRHDLAGHEATFQLGAHNGKEVAIEVRLLPANAPAVTIPQSQTPVVAPVTQGGSHGSAK